MTTQMNKYRARQNSHTMKIRWTDVYEEYAFISDDDYQAILDTKRQEMAHYIIKNCFTKRTNLFKSAYEIAINAMEKFKVNRINSIEDINNPKTTFKYAMEIIQQLVENGYLIQVVDSDRQLIRSMNKTEQRKNKIIPAADKTKKITAIISSRLKKEYLMKKALLRRPQLRKAGAEKKVHFIK